MNKIPKYRIEYWFKDSKMGFSNSITVEAISPEQASEKAKKEVGMAYGSAWVKKKFTFKEPILV